MATKFLRKISALLERQDLASHKAFSRPAAARGAMRCYSSVTWLVVALVSATLGLSGCGSGSGYPVVSTISFPNGSMSSLQPGGTIALSATLTNDTKALGLDWLATCTPPTSVTPVTSATSALCGTFSPTHTASGAITNFTAPVAIPTNGTVTITATSTTDPTRSVTTTLTISGQAITVSITPSTATVGINESVPLTAVVANDPANAGVTWSVLNCSGGTPLNCGGFSASPDFMQTQVAASGTPVIYYAPAVIPTNATITLQATSISNPTISSLPVNVQIVPDITVSFSPAPPANVAPGATIQLTAVVTNDFAAAGVTWTASAGTISPTTTGSGVPTSYTAPSGVPQGTTVTITATSVTDPTIFATANIPIGSSSSSAVVITSAVSSLTPGGTALFSASVIGDSAGVNWTATAGSFSPTQTGNGIDTTYTAPSSGASSVTITATSVTYPSESATVTVNISGSGGSSGGNSLLKGQYVFNMTGQYPFPPAGAGIYDAAYETYVGSIIADGNGNITGGEIDFYSGGTFAGNPINFTGITGTYDIGPSGQGTITLINATQGYQEELNVSLVSTSHALISSTGIGALLTTYQEQSGGILNGTLDLQTTSAFSHSLSGTYSFTFSDVFAENGSQDPDNLGGVMTISNGSVTKYVIDENLYSNWSGTKTYTVPGDAFLAADSFGRGTVTFSHFGTNYSGTTFVYYLVDGTHFIIDNTTSGGGSGVAYQQPSTVPTSLAGSYAFTESGWYYDPNGFISIIDAGGLFTCDSSGNLTAGTLDVNSSLNPTTQVSGTAVFNSAPVTAGTCAMDSSGDGRGTVNITSANSGLVSQFAVYPTANNGLLMLELDSTADGTGTAYTQASGVSAASFTGSYAGNFQSYNADASDFFTIVGNFTANGLAGLTGTANTLNLLGTDAQSNTSVTGAALTDTGNGRLTGDINIQSINIDAQQVFYVVNPSTVLTLESDGSVGTGILQTVTASAASPISVSITGNPATLATGATANLTATVSNDSSNEGVTWTVSPAGSGSFSSTTTASGVATTYTAPPAAGSVTITATSVKDPTKSATATITINSPVVTVTVSSPDTTVAAGGGTAPFTATVMNGTGNVTWTATAGTFSSTTTASGVATTYNAPSTVPSQNPVTVTATYANNIVGTATIQITAPVLSISSITVPQASMPVSTTQMLSATVSNDPSNEGIDWTASGGTFNNNQATVNTASGANVTFNAPSAIPSGGTVTITATVKSTEGSQNPVYTTTMITIDAAAPVITLTPSSASLDTGGSTTFSASVANDNTGDGVSWTATAGTFSSTSTTSATYVAPSTVPSGGTVTITATSIADSQVTATVTVNVASATAGNAFLTGQYAFSTIGQNPAAAPFDQNNENYIGSFTTDGNGNITSWEIDFYDGYQTSEIHYTGTTGTYNVDAAGHGQVELTNTAANIEYDVKFRIALTTTSHGEIMIASPSENPNSVTNGGSEFDGGYISGSLDQQTASSFSTPLSGNYAFIFSAFNFTLGDEPDNVGGVLTISSNTLTQELIDENDNGAYGLVNIVGPTSTTVSNAFSAPDANGRGTVTLTHFGRESNDTFYYYKIDNTHFVFLNKGTSSYIGGGTAYLQAATPPTALQGGYAFTETGFINPSFAGAGPGLSGVNAGGVFNCDGSGNLTSYGALDINDESVSPPTVTSTPITDGACTFNSAQGRGTVGFNTTSNAGGLTVQNFAVYPTASGSLLMLELDQNADGIGIGYPQAASIAASAFSGTYTGNLQSYYLNGDDMLTAVGTFVASGTTALTGTVDTFESGEQDPYIGGALTSAALTDNTDGRLSGTLQIPNYGALSEMFYIVNANTVLTLNTDAPTSQNPGGREGTGILQLQSLP